MDTTGYTLITFCPFLIWVFVYFIVMVVSICKGRFSDFVDFINLNVFPEILEVKKDGNTTLIYFGQDKTLLRGKTLINRVKSGLYFTALNLFIYASLVFGQQALLEYSYDCDTDKDCFLWPLNTTSDARANCSDPFIIRGKQPVICYHLAFQPELGVGVTYGLYKVSKIIVSIAVTLITKLNKKRLVYLRVTVVFVLVSVFVVFVVLSDIYQTEIRNNSNSHPERDNQTTKEIYTYLLVCVTIVVVVFGIPWNGIVQAKEESRMISNDVRASTQYSSIP